jgi:hypothetical protein
MCVQRKGHGRMQKVGIICKMGREAPTESNPADTSSLDFWPAKLRKQVAVV